MLSGPECDGAVRLSVAAAPEIAPAVRSTAGWAEGASIDGKCVAVKVTAQDSADEAAVVATRQQQRLLGLGEAKGSGQIPQVWAPDSSMWPLRLQAVASGFRPTDATSIAVSPVVLAVPQPVVSGSARPARR